MERLGFGYEKVAALNPQLIYCRLKGFMEGPYEQRTALDEVVQMMSGLAYMTGPPGRPLRAGASIVDIMSGTFGALGVLAALREREQSGKGRLVTSGLFETAAYIMGQHMAYGVIAQEPVPPMPARVSPWAVYRLFRTRDEQKIFVGITSDKHWQAFCETFERPDLLADETLATNNRRVAARERLHQELEEFFATMTLQEIVRRCEEAGIPFSPIARPEDLFDDPQLNEGDSLVSVSLPDGRQAKLPRLPLAMNGTRLDLRFNPPEVGQHTRRLLAGLGYGEEEIDGLLEAEIIVAPS
jgi:crotonobetainyl-CoA:carnitine CoA-transferase CaiB-like acyl-CoA transferase